MSRQRCSQSRCKSGRSVEMSAIQQNTIHDTYLPQGGELAHTCRSARRSIARVRKSIELSKFVANQDRAAFSASSDDLGAVRSDTICACSSTDARTVPKPWRNLKPALISQTSPPSASCLATALATLPPTLPLRFLMTASGELPSLADPGR